MHAYQDDNVIILINLVLKSWKTLFSEGKNHIKEISGVTDLRSLMPLTDDLLLRLNFSWVGSSLLDTDIAP
jgi:hypothetical protein